jgi:hypothetical protein
MRGKRWKGREEKFRNRNFDRKYEKGSRNVSRKR